MKEFYKHHKKDIKTGIIRFSIILGALGILCLVNYLKH